MKYLSLFSGIGGFELGITQAYEKILSSMGSQPTDEKSQQTESEVQLRRERPVCIGFSEIDKYATQIYKKHFNHTEYGDITKLNAWELPQFDLLVGGFPCQAFSIAGKRGGFSDTRGTLFFEIARIAREKQPRLLLLENVKGLLSHDKGNTFFTIISTLDELGYDCEWQVLNSKDFGVPQNRERVFIIGHLRGGGRREVFPVGATNGKDINQLNQPKHSNDRVYSDKGLSPTLNTMQGGNRQPFIVEQRTDEGLRTFKDNICGTLRTTADCGDKRVIEGARIRRLTCVECERLQGFPDGWTEGISDTQRYKCLGNAVTVNVIETIMTKLLYE